MTDYRVRVDGVWVDQWAHVGAVKHSTRHGFEGPCGPMLASCVIDVDPSNDSSWMMLGKKFEVIVDGVVEFGGRISEMGRGYPREVYAKSWARLIGGESTTGERWGRTAENTAYTPVEPTSPTWLLDASGLDIGVADDRLFTRVVATYVSGQTTDPGTGQTVDTIATVTLNNAEAQTLYGVLIYDMDLTGLGVLSSGEATTHAQAQLAEFAIPEWLSRMTLTDMELLTPGGLPAHLPSVRAGQLVRMFNVPNNLGGLRSLMSLDVVLGEVEASSDEVGQVSVAPMRLAVRNIADSLVAAKRAADEAAKTAAA